MYPELFRIGEFPITSYGLWLAVGMLAALFAASRLAARDGLPRERIYDLGLWALVGGLLGSKVLMFFVEENVHVLSLDFLRSGGVYYGGLIGGFLAVVGLRTALQAPILESSGRICTGSRSRPGFWSPGMFRGGLLLGKTDRSFLGRAF
jgi:phosphatidylglycerol:prolipoprotein diacylglycerol transferase